MKKMLTSIITLFCFFIASAQKIEFKKDNIYLNNKKIDAYECEEKDFISQFGNPELREVKTFIECNYYKKGMEVYFDRRNSTFNYMMVYFEPMEKLAAFKGEFFINGNKITGNTSVQDLKKMKGIKITKEPTEDHRYIDYEIESGDANFTLTYRRGGKEMIWLQAEL
jgi:hypothetical protein